MNPVALDKGLELKSWLPRCEVGSRCQLLGRRLSKDCYAQGIPGSACFSLSPVSRLQLLHCHGPFGMSKGLLEPPVSGTQLWHPFPTKAPSPSQLMAIQPCCSEWQAPNLGVLLDPLSLSHPLV